MSNTDNEIVTPVRVVVELGNCGVIAAYSDAPIDLVILDHDVSEDTNNITVDGIQVSMYHIDVEVDDDQCQVVFKEVEDYEQSLEVPLVNG